MKLTENDENIVMTVNSIKRIVQISAMFLEYREGYDDEIEYYSLEECFWIQLKKNHLIGVRINIPLNLTHYNIWNEHKTRGFYPL